MTDRRTVLLAAGTAAAAAVSGSVSAQVTSIHGTVDYEGGKVIPEGYLKISVDDAAEQNPAQHSASGVRVESNGASKVMDFTMPVPALPGGLEGAQIVARLERVDGWLLARGSVQFELNSPLHITLFTAMY